MSRVGAVPPPGAHWRSGYGWAVAAAVVLLGGANPARAAEKIILQLHGPAQFEFAGYYAALWRGFYKEAGLSVEIKPAATAAGQTPADPARDVAEGRAQFGTGTAQLIVRIAQGQPLVVVAPIFQDSGAAVYYRGDSYFASPAALARAKLGRLPASNILDIELTSALRAEGIDPAQLNSVPLEPDQTVPALADRSVDAAVGSAWSTPWQAREKGLTLRSFDLADYRVAFYGDMLFTGRRFEKAEPDTVRRFRAATLKGWDYTLQHADELIGRLLAEPGGPAVGDPGGFARYQAETARRLAHYPEIPIGHSNPDRWKRIEDALATAGVLTHPPDPDSFVYDPDARARSSADLRAFALLGGALLIALTVGFLIWRAKSRPTRESASLRETEMAAVTAPSPGLPAAAALAEPESIAASEAPSGPSADAMPWAEPPAAIGTSATGRSEEPTAASEPTGPSQQEPMAADSNFAPSQETAAQPEPAAPTVAARSEPPPSTSTAIELNPILSRYERTLRQRLPRRIEFRLSLLPELWRCHADARVLRRLVLDLALAAAADLPQGASLIVGTRNFSFASDRLEDYPGAELGEYVRVTIRDNGAGMASEAVDRVFQTKPAIAAAQQAMRRLGGYVRVESAEGVGTAVHLYFRRARQAAVPAEAAQ